MKKYREIVIGFMVVLALGFLWGRVSHKMADTHEVHEFAEDASIRFWTCAMHPQIQKTGPGPCPICGMDLISVAHEDGYEELEAREVKLSSTAERLANIQVAPVARKLAEIEVQLVGKVDYDETRLSTIAAWVPGRLDRLYVDYTGIPVKEGDHLISLYSPELLTAQEELIQALKTATHLQKSALSTIKDRANTTVESSREKLRLWGLTAEQIQAIEQNETTSDHLTIHAPISGIVIHKDALEGMYVKTGTRIYTIADLSKVWVKLNAYESDLAWLRYGQEVTFETETYPGDVFHGKIAFIDPVLDSKTRTVKVRVNVPNAEGKLKPEMFVRATVRSHVASADKVMEPALSGKWIGPMHPEIIKDESGTCELCGMPLVPAESLGYVSASSVEAPLVIPASAPLITGKRAVVYVKVPEKKGVYEGREIVLGPRAGDSYIVREGLDEGELVVLKGNFKIDSAVQIQAKPSMMNPEDGGLVPGPTQKNQGSGTKIKEGREKEPIPAKSERDQGSSVTVPLALLSQLNEFHSKALAFGFRAPAREAHQHD